MSRSHRSRSAFATFLRSFLIQSSWNYRTMIGTGFGLAMLPGLRRIFSGRPEEFEAAVERHVEHFNAHPYLASVALGASLRLEADGVTPETVRRFKTAVRGPLGGLGDALVWATWLPVVSMIAVASYWLGLPGPWAAALFLMLYNTGHIGLRIWGFWAGLEAGRDVAGKLAAARFSAWTMRLRSWGVVVLGILAGAVLGGEGGLGDAGSVWAALAAAGFLLGLLVGHHVWRPAAVAVVAAIALLATWGSIR
ncbi:MAG: PTS system mannose/fructose/sorbose family transporter subunit IID [Gemmatimonadota bacterium]